MSNQSPRTLQEFGFKGSWRQGPFQIADSLTIEAINIGNVAQEFNSL